MPTKKKLEKYQNPGPVGWSQGISPNAATIKPATRSDEARETQKDINARQEKINKVAKSILDSKGIDDFTDEDIDILSQSTVPNVTKILRDYRINIANKAQENQAGIIPTAEEFKNNTAAIGDKLSLQRLPGVGQYIPDVLDVTGGIGQMAAGLGAIPSNLQQGQYGQAVLNLGLPLLTGALSGLGTTTRGQFLNNLVNPMAGAGDILSSTKIATNTTKNLEDLKYLKDWSKKYGYELPEDINRIAQSDVLTDRTVRGVMNRHNTFVRGVSTNWDEIGKRNPEILRHLEGKGIDWQNNPQAAAEYMATHVPIQTSYGRASLDGSVFQQGLDGLYTSNSLPTAEGYTYGQGYINKVKKPTDFSSSDRQDWITKNNPSYTDEDEFRKLNFFNTEFGDEMANRLKGIVDSDAKDYSHLSKEEKIDKIKYRYEVFKRNSANDTRYLKDLDEDLEKLTNNIDVIGKSKFDNKLLRTERAPRELNYYDTFTFNKRLDEFLKNKGFNMNSSINKPGIGENIYKDIVKIQREHPNAPNITLKYLRDNHPDFFETNKYAHYIHIGTPGEKILEPVKSWEITPDIWKNKSRAHTNVYTKGLSALSLLPPAIGLGAAGLSQQNEEQDPQNFQQGGATTDNMKKKKLEKYQNSGPVKDQSFIPSINNIFQQGLGIAPNITNPGGNPFGTNIFGDQLTKGIFDTGQLFKGTQQLNQLETPLGAWGGDVSKGIEKSILDEDMKKYKADNFFNSAKAWADESGQTFSEPSKMFGAYQKSIQDRAGQRYDNTISAQKTWNEYGKPLAANMAAMEKLTDMQAVEGLKGNKNALYRVDDEVKGMESKGIFQMGGAPQISALQQALGYKDNSPFKKLPSQTILRNMSADGVNITMDGVSKNLYLIPDKGRPVLAQGNSGEYYFPNANAVEEIPAMQDGGASMLADTISNNKRAIGNLNRNTSTLKAHKDINLTPQGVAKRMVEDLLRIEDLKRQEEKGATNEASQLVTKRGLNIDEKELQTKLIDLYNRQNYNEALELAGITEGDISIYTDNLLAVSDLMNEYGVKELKRPQQNRLRRIIGNNSGFFDPSTDTVYARDLNQIVEEVAHGQGYRRQYKTPGTMEYEAHSVIAPKLHEEVTDKRKRFAGIFQQGGYPFLPTPRPISDGLNDDEIKAEIKRHEGAVIDKSGRHNIYKDSEGYNTIGYGHLWRPVEPVSLNQEQADAVFERDYERHKAYASQIPGWDKATPEQKKALINLTFNMGEGWYKKFPKFTEAMKKGDYNSATKELKDSLWYQQVGSRANDVIRSLSNGNTQSFQQGGGAYPNLGDFNKQVSHRDSVANLALNTVLYEKHQGSGTGKGLPNAGIKGHVGPISDEDAVDWAMQNIYPQLEEGYESAMDKGIGLDFYYNAGLDPRIYAYQEYLRKTDPQNKTGWQDKDGNWKDRNKYRQQGMSKFNGATGKWEAQGKWVDQNLKNEFDSLWEKSGIPEMSENDRGIILNNGRDWYYQNTNKGSGEYENTWYGRVNNDKYKRFSPNQPKLKKKEEGGPTNLPTPTEPTYNYLTDFEKLEYVKKLKGYVEKYGFESLVDSYPKGAAFLQEQLELLSKGDTDPKDPPVVGGNPAEGEDIIITAKRKREGSNGEITALPSVGERLMNPVQLERNDDLFKEIIEGFKEQKSAAQREQEYKRKLQLMFAEQQRKNQQEDSNIYTGRGRYAKEGGTIQNFQNSGSPIINPNQATRQDSINVTNAAKAVDAYYASLMKKGWYSKKDVLKIPTSLTQNELKKSMDRVKERSISTYENDIESARILGEPDMYYRNVYPQRDLSQYLSEVEKSLSDTKKGSGTKYYYKDLLPSIIDPVAPSTLIDTRIKPQFRVKYIAKYPRDKKRSPVGGSVTALYTYDPIATTPVDLLTPSELKRRQELYPDSFGAKPSIKTNKKPFKKEIPPSPRDLVEIDPLQQQELRQLDIPQRQVDMSNVEHTDYESGEMVKPYEGVPNVNVVFKKRKSDGRLVPFAYENSEGERIGYNETLTKKFQYPGKFQSGGIPILNLSKNINPMRLNPQGIYKMGGLITEGSEYNKRKQPKKNSITGASSTGPMGPKDIPSYDGGIRAIIDQEKNEIIPTENLIPIQAEKGELIVLPTGDVVPVMAKKRHHQMDEDEVTDVAPEGAYILSSFGRVKIKKKEAENVIAETGVKPYKLGIGQETPTEKTLGDIMTKKEMAPAEVGRLISRRFPVIATDNPYEAAANTENKINRRPYLEGLIQLSEFDKMRKGIDTSTPEATREYRDEEEEMYEYEGRENEMEGTDVEEMMQGGNPMFRRNILHAKDPLTAAAIQEGSGLLQSIISIISSAQQRKAADKAYRDVLRMSNQSADRQRGQLGLGAAAGILGTLSQDPTVNAAYLNPTYINQMQTRTPSQITDSIANSAFANMPTFSNLAPQQQMLASQAAWGQALKAAGDARMNAWAGDRTARNQQLQSLQQYYDTNENNRVAAQNATRLNRNQQIGNVGDRTQGYFDSTATIEANLGQTQANARLGQGAAQQQAIRSYTQGINQAIGTAGAAAYDYFSKKDGTTGTTTPPNTCWSLPDSMGRRYQIPC